MDKSIGENYRVYACLLMPLSSTVRLMMVTLCEVTKADDLEHYNKDIITSARDNSKTKSICREHENRKMLIIFSCPLQQICCV